MTEVPRQLYKYVPVKAAMSILINRRLRWSSPLTFNDPLDVPREIAHGFTTADIVNASRQRLIELIAAPPPLEECTEYKDGVQRLLAELRQQPDIGQRALEALTAELRPVNEADLEGLRETWREHVPKMRILCLSSRCDSLSMWNHYSDKYTGAVIEFEIGDRARLNISPTEVRYPKETPKLFLAAGWAELLLKQDVYWTEAMIDEFLFKKAKDWEYEDEWRVLEVAVGESGKLYLDKPFHPHSINRVILGPFMQESDATAIMELLKHEDYAHVKVDCVALKDRSMLFNRMKG